uniref:C2H2-type domain-containing protein n=1 Tax=Steinernema glaseri TaxID=37863 RepID=A0A1I7YGD9_9BILA
MSTEKNQTTPAQAAQEVTKSANECSKTKQVAASGALTRMDPSSPSDFSLDSGFDSPSSSFPSSPESWHLQTAPLCNTTQIEIISAALVAQAPSAECAPLPEESSNFSESGLRPSTSLCSSETLSQCSFETSSLITDVKPIDNQYYIQCEWNECQKVLLSENDIYDHVVGEHIAALKCLKKEEGKGAESEKKPKNDGEDDRFECKWANCEMNITRGDAAKKFEWLREHFASRHVPHAQTSFCLYSECKARFSGKRALQDHLRLVHDKRNKPAKRANDHSAASRVQLDAACMVWSPNLYCKSKERHNDFLDLKTMSWVYTQTMRHTDMNRPMFVASCGNPPQLGARYRKARRMTNYMLEEDCAVPAGPEHPFEQSISTNM